MRTTSSESTEQIGFLQWFRIKFPDILIFHIPNGGARHIKTATRLKEEGVVPGIPDLFIPTWNLWIEMKVPGGKLSKPQEGIIKYLESCGHTVIVGYGARDASEKVMKLVKIK